MHNLWEGWGLVDEIFVYWVGVIIFGFSSLMFTVLEKRKQDSKLVFESNIFVSFITTISYVVLALALGTVIAENGQPVYWTRWLFYIASCSILTLDIASRSRKPNSKKAEIAVFTGLTMFCGFLASIIVIVDRWWFFALSTTAYLGMLFTLFSRSGDEKLNLSKVMWFVMITWSLFPIVWVLAPTGLGIIKIQVEAVLYLTLDFITKIAFGLYLLNQKPTNS